MILPTAPAMNRLRQLTPSTTSRAVPAGNRAKANRKATPICPLHGINGSIHKVMRRRRGESTTRLPAMDTVLHRNPIIRGMADFPSMPRPLRKESMRYATRAR